MKTPKEITPELAEETGWHIGDGSMNYYKNYGKLRGFYQLRGHIEDDRLHYINRVKPMFKLLYDLDVSLREMPSTRVFGFQIWNCDLVNFKKKLGLPLGKKFDVSIPKIFLKNKEFQKAIIRGIFDTDGGIYLGMKNNKLYPRLCVTTISVKLSEQLLQILKELGFRVTRYSQLFNREFNRQRAYFITIRGVKMFHKFIKEVNPKNLKHQEKFQKFLDSQNL